jgi:hypothetical protein
MSCHSTGLGVVDLDSCPRAKVIFLNIIKTLDMLEYIRSQIWLALYSLYIVG